MRISIKVLLLAVCLILLHACKDECKNVTCINGDCVDGTCQCDEGYTGAQCDQIIDPCQGVTCENGECVNGVCECEPGWGGTNCDELIDPCAIITCENGECVDGNCVCEEGYEGEFCETEIRAKYFGNWTGTPECDNDMIPIQDINVLIEGVEENINQLAIELQLEGVGVDFPRDTVDLFGNTFVGGPSAIELFGFEFEGESTGIFKSDTTLALKFSITGEVNSFPVTVKCDADLIKQQ